MIQCFYNPGSESVPDHCIGILLEYSNERREALGQCRIGTLQTIHVAPARMYMKCEPRRQGVFIHFGSDHPDGLGWVVIEMIGEMTWWFNENHVNIVHSGKWVTAWK
jgi:hypothetical protein